MAALGVGGRSTLLGPIIRAATGRSLIRPRARFSVPNPNSAFARPITSSVIEASASRFLRREMSTHHPFHSAIAAACLVSKLPSDVTASYEEKERRC
ncbi:PREDICTED: pentatricopeptide repeat-containing protein At2g27800, mitochondrial-like isoform X2 [Tarenaya hassleriana]|uniref:pentatricopeptide repeat-containing protein At2g27800, mitochondrial-like isoform X2 n=1 Tax=Tarenaya hassleriana TaxID=28532 RepID=UPI00053C3239|nr:PREDICTED: pentatricopeptide repeat-containing protein At2g27800, mitochondrial-like isoform X2 [Tarenaya hassleriana]